jgi:Xaa-Pro aminopeptidase
MNPVEMIKQKGVVMRPRPFDDAEYARRLDQVKERMAAEGLDVLICSNTANIGYLTGYDVTMPSCYSVLIVEADGTTTFHSPTNEAITMLDSGKVDHLEIFDWFEAQSTGHDLVRILQEKGIGDKRIGLEMGNPEVYSIGAFDTKSFLALQEGLPKAEFVEATLLVLGVREIKTEAELEYMRIAGTYTWAGLKAGIDTVGAGVPDNVVAAAAFNGALSAGSELMSIDPMVISGSRTGYFPHVVFRRDAPEAGEPVYFEMTGTHNRYNAPSMRTACTGKPSAEVQSMADASINMLRFLVENIKPGKSCDELARETQALGVGGDDVYFHGGYGYSIGMGFQPSWCEAPLYIAVDSDRTLEKGMCFHLVELLHIPGGRGVGFSESVTVTDTGCEVLTPMEGLELAVK